MVKVRISAEKVRKPYLQYLQYTVFNFYKVGKNFLGADSHFSALFRLYAPPLSATPNTYAYLRTLTHNRAQLTKTEHNYATIAPQLQRPKTVQKKLLVSLRVDKYRVALKHPHHYKTPCCSTLLNSSLPFDCCEHVLQNSVKFVDWCGAQTWDGRGCL